MPEPPPAVATPPPAVATPAPPPLAGLHVVTLATNLPGPVAASRFRSLGAAVTKVEPPTGDPLATVSPRGYADLAAGQEVVALDLKDDRGRARLLQILRGADLLLTSTRPRALERLGLGWTRLHEHAPRLCHVAILGAAPPDDEAAGHDLTYQASAGTLDPPALPRVLVADLAGAERAVSEGLTALLLRSATGLATRREVALTEAAHEMARPIRWGLTAPGGPLGGGLAAYAMYAAADGHVALAALEGHFRDRVCRLLGVAGTSEEFRRVFATRTAGQWQEWAREHDVPLVAVRPAGDTADAARADAARASGGERGRDGARNSEAGGIVHPVIEY